MRGGRTGVAIAIALVALGWGSAAAAQELNPREMMAVIEAGQGSEGPMELGLHSIAELMEVLNVPGVSIAVIHDFEIHWAKGYGVADVETGVRVDIETVFQAASISKPVAAVAVMRAAQDDLFTLDTDINDILTSWELDGAGLTDEQPVTPRSLTSHTSGWATASAFPATTPTRPCRRSFRSSMDTNSRTSDRSSWSDPRTRAWSTPAAASRSCSRPSPMPTDGPSRRSFATSCSIRSR